MADSFCDSRYPPLAHIPNKSTPPQSATHSSRSSESSIRHFPPRTSSQHSSQLSHSQLRQQQQQQHSEPLPTLISESRKPSLTTTESQTSRSRAYSTKSSTSTTSVKRKPLPTTAAPAVPHYSPRVSLASSIDTVIVPPKRRSFSEDSPVLHENPLHYNQVLSQSRYMTSGVVHYEELENQSNENHHHLAEYVAAIPAQDIDFEEDIDQLSHHHFVRNQTPLSTDYAHHERLFSESGISASSHSTRTSMHEVESSDSRPTTMSILTAKPVPLALDLPQHIEHDLSLDINKALPKSPSPTLLRGSKLGSFFNWRGERSSLSPSSPNTEHTDDKGGLSVSSPHSTHDSQIQHNIINDTNVANDKHNSYFGGAYLSTPDTGSHLDEMEDELKAISTELAISIRREMELEDLVEKMQSEASQSEKRSSDYFSDSGVTSLKYGNGFDTKTEELERLHRRSEREKAQLRLELTDRVNEERSRRRVLESQIQQLEERASLAERRSFNNEESNSRLRDLENTCEDLRRRLNEEKQIKENFEDLLTALKGDLHHSHNERDNLREEIVPQLRKQIEGLEAQAIAREQQSYENSKLQQELQSLRDENTTLVNARAVQADMQRQMSRFNTIVEQEPSAVAGPLMKMSRSATISGRGRDRSVGSSLNRSTSVKGAVESRDELAERVKDIEAQRDALHMALKALLERQEHQNRVHQAKVKQLESERDRMASSIPRRYDREVQNLKNEITALRRRADEAIEQKWQCEKGLGGLKMDLERAEQEIGSLKKLLAESSPKVEGALSRSNSVTSTSLERAYEDLRQARATSLEQVQDLEHRVNADSTSADLTQSMQEVNDHEAEIVNATNAALYTSEKQHLTAEQALANELRESAARVEQLAIQVQGQLTTNASLRQRLADTIDRGEQEQRRNTARVVFMQEKLQRLEQELLVAQLNSEERLAKHEEEVHSLKNSHNVQLLRIRTGLASAKTFSPRSPLSPLFHKNKNSRSDCTTPSSGLTVHEQARTAELKARVEDLENALEDADQEMEEVMKKMNHAQIEVMELWNEREEAVRTTRKLELEIAAERKKGFMGRMRTLQV